MEPVPVAPAWTSATFLEYLGALVGGAALLALFAVVNDEQGTGGLVGWSALALLLVGAAAELVRRRGEAVVAGLLAVVAVLVWGVLAGAVLQGIGLLPDREDGPFFNEGLALDVVVLETLVIAAAALAFRRFRFPLLVLPLAAVLWYGLMDLLEGVLGGGNTATSLLALVVGLFFVLFAVAQDSGGHHPSAFWVHVVGGLSVGGAVLWFWHEHTWEWLLVLVVSLVYVAVARATGRSSYAVLGAVGLFGTATYFIEKWFSLGSLVPFFTAEPGDVDEWGRPLVYLALGAVFVVLGVLVDRARGGSPPPAAPPAT
jgi:hypothetical protein